MKDFIIKHWLTVLFGAITTAVTSLYAKAKAKSKRVEHLTVGVKGVSICMILMMHNLYMERGHITAEEFKIVSELNDGYKGLGGNGTARALMHDLENLLLKTKGETK